jgi:hypothetical protein
MTAVHPGNPWWMPVPFEPSMSAEVWVSAQLPAPSFLSFAHFCLSEDLSNLTYVCTSLTTTLVEFL